MISGGFGLILGGDGTNAENMAYGIVAGIIWVTWISVSIWHEYRRAKTGASYKSSGGSSPQDEEEMRVKT